MKLALASLLFAAPAMAFAPSASFGVNSALKMSTETEQEKVRPRVRDFEDVDDHHYLETKEVIRCDQLRRIVCEDIMSTPRLLFMNGNVTFWRKH